MTNLARPDRNATGISALGPDLISKRIEILKECVPGLARVAFLWNPDNDSNLAFLEELIIAVPALGLQLISVPMRTSDDFEGAFAAMMQRRPNGFVTTNDGLILQHMGQVIDFMATGRSPDARSKVKVQFDLDSCHSAHLPTLMTDRSSRRSNKACAKLA